MTEAEQERAAVVAFLLEPVHNNMNFLHKIHMAWRVFRDPSRLVRSILLNCANAIENREHLKE